MLPIALAVLTLAADPEPTSVVLPAGAVARFGDFHKRGGYLGWATFSPDGTKLVRWRYERIEIIDLASGRDVTPESVRAARASRAYVLHDGRLLVFETNPTRRLWVADPKTGELLEEIDCDGRNPLVVQVTPDGKGAAVTTSGANVYGCTVLDLTGAKAKVRHFPATTYAAYALSPDRRRLFAMSQANGLEMTDVATDKLLDSDKSGINQNIYTPVVSQDGKRVMAFANGRTHAYDVSGDKLTPVRTAGVNYSLSEAVVLEGGERVFLGGGQHAYSFETGTLEPLRTDHSRTNLASCYAAANGRYAIDTFSAQLSVVWDLRTGKTLHRLEQLPEVRGVRFLDDKTILTHDIDRVARVWDRRTGEMKEEWAKRKRDAKQVSTFGFVGETGRATYEFDRGTGEVRRADTSTGAVDAAWDLGVSAAVNVMSVADRGDLDRATVSYGTGVAVVELSTGRHLRTLSEPGSSAVFSPNGRLIAVATDYRVSLVETATNKVRRTLDAPRPGAAANPNSFSRSPRQPSRPASYTAGVRFSSDGERIALFYGEGSISVWQTNDGLLLYHDSFTGGVRIGTLSPDGRWLVSSSPDRNTLYLRDLEEPKLGRGTYAITGALGPFSTVEFAADSKQILTGHADGLAYLWDVEKVVQSAHAPAKADRLDTVWSDLADPDATKAGLAIDRLLADPTRAVPLLAANVKPVAAPDVKAVAGWIDALKAAGYADRQAAEKELAGLHHLIAAELQEALKGATESAEQQMRLTRLLTLLNKPDPNPDRTRLLRAVEVLERLGTPDARRVLEALAGGWPGAEATKDAARSLARLSR